MSSFDENIAELRGVRDDTSRHNQDSDDATTLSQQHHQDSETQPLLASSSPRQRTPSKRAINSTSEEHLPASSSETDPESQHPSAGPAMPSPLFFTLSTLYGASSVALGAFGAHGLRQRITDPSRLQNWSTAAQYQVIHSVALLATSLALPHKASRIPASLFVAGMTMFSGSIYLLVLDPQRFKALGPVTPLGGLCLIGGWISLGLVGRRFVMLK